MGILNGYIPVDRGTLTFPWGDNGIVIEVVAMQSGHRAPVMSTLGPADLGSGKTTFTTGDREYRFTVLGKYVHGGATATTIDVPETGSATIQFGSGETWVGPIRVSQGEWRGRWPSNRADVTLDIMFSGKPTITNAT